MKLLDWLKEKLKLENLQKLSQSKKTIPNLIIIFCIGLALLLISDFYNDIKLKEPAEEKQSSAINETGSIGGDLDTAYVKNLENQLSTILGKIENAGKVSVMITLKGGTEIIPAKDESTADRVTNEKDENGGTRTINEKTVSDKVVFVATQGGQTKPLIIKETNPEVRGVIVVAEGARDAKVKLRISEAVQTVLDIPAYRVTVYEKN